MPHFSGCFASNDQSQRPGQGQLAVQPCSRLVHTLEAWHIPSHSYSWYVGWDSRSGTWDIRIAEPSGRLGASHTPCLVGTAAWTSDCRTETCQVADLEYHGM